MKRVLALLCISLLVLLTGCPGPIPDYGLHVYGGEVKGATRQFSEGEAVSLTLSPNKAWRGELAFAAYIAGAKTFKQIALPIQKQKSGEVRLRANSWTEAGVARGKWTLCVAVAPKKKLPKEAQVSAACSSGEAPTGWQLIKRSVIITY